ncbi:MAG: lytic transglycosylase domain-containing protein [Erythrobacter sp.]
MSAHRLAVALLTAFATILHAPVYAQPEPASERAQGIDIARYVREASQRFGLPERWIYAVIRVESAGQTRAVSPAGAMGLMQLMPGTWARQRARLALGSDPFDPRDNILAGTSYLREMYDLYGADGFLAAYNAGPGRYQQWRDGARPLPLETRRYVARIAPLLQRDSMTFATASHADGGARAVPPILPRPLKSPAQQGRQEPSANPFAGPEQPAHDLFAPVSTSHDQ